jgi:hypothetical protein
MECGNALPKERIMITTKPKLIGLSLSFCVVDLVRRRIAYSQVIKLITGTAADGDEAWRELLEDYRRHRWDDWYPMKESSAKLADRAVRYANRLRKEGKIEQPRLVTGLTPSWNGGRAKWVRSESEIRWSDPREV